MPNPNERTNMTISVSKIERAKITKAIAALKNTTPSRCHIGAIVSEACNLLFKTTKASWLPA